MAPASAAASAAVWSWALPRATTDKSTDRATSPTMIGRNTAVMTMTFPRHRLALTRSSVFMAVISQWVGGLRAHGGRQDHQPARAPHHGSRRPRTEAARLRQDSLLIGPGGTRAVWSPWRVLIFGSLPSGR